jgi:hypothetical protein
VNPSPEAESTGQLQALQRFWDARYDSDDFAFGMQPNDFLVQRIGALAGRGRALCLAEGEGRNGVWLEPRFTGVRTLREGRLHVGARVVVQIAARKRAG